MKQVLICKKIRYSNPLRHMNIEMPDVVSFVKIKPIAKRLKCVGEILLLLPESPINNLQSNFINHLKYEKIMGIIVSK